jgi:hypothetical protein
MDLRGHSLLAVTDLNAEEFKYLVELARKLRGERRFGFGFDERRLAGRNIALIFEKPSTRTRAAFEVAAHHEGAHVSYLGPGETQLGRKESVRDTARVLGRMFDAIEYRGFDQEAVETLAAYAGVPVWNGLTDSVRVQQRRKLESGRAHSGDPPRCPRPGSRRPGWPALQGFVIRRSEAAQQPIEVSIGTGHRCSPPFSSSPLSLLRRRPGGHGQTPARAGPSSQAQPARALKPGSSNAAPSRASRRPRRPSVAC